VTPLAHLLRRPVPLDLAGERWQANPLRLSDLADLAILACQAWARPVAPDADPSTPEGAAAWRAACDAAEPPPPDWGSDACTTVALGTTPGRLAILGAVLSDHGLSFEDVQAVAEQMTADEWAAVVAVAFASDPREEVEARLNLALGVPPFKPEKRRTLAEAVASAAVELGCAPSALGEWTVAEWREYQQGVHGAGPGDGPRAVRPLRGRGAAATRGVLQRGIGRSSARSITPVRPTAGPSSTRTHAHRSASPLTSPSGSYSGTPRGAGSAITRTATPMPGDGSSSWAVDTPDSG
jgi:hypothetical protein